MLLIHQLLLSVLIVAVSAQSIQNLPLLAKNIDTETTSAIGTLQLNTETGRIEVVDVPESFDEQDGSYCLGAEVNGQFKCYTLVDNVESPLAFDLVLSSKPSGGLISLTFTKSKKPGINAVIRQSLPGPEPLLKKTTQKAQTTQEQQEEEPPKSFIQKYWMYIVPVLVLMMMSSGDGAAS